VTRRRDGGWKKKRDAVVFKPMGREGEGWASQVFGGGDRRLRQGSGKEGKKRFRKKKWSAQLSTGTKVVKGDTDGSVGVKAALNRIADGLKKQRLRRLEKERLFSKGKEKREKS